MSKIKVIEVIGQKLDPNSKYLIVFNNGLLNMEEMGNIADQLEKIGVIAAYTHCVNPEEALKVYEIPKETK